MKKIKLLSVFEDQEGYKETWDKLKEDHKFMDRRYFFKKVNKRQGYGHEVYNGTLNEGIDLTPLEIALILNNGYSWFGGDITLIGDDFFCEILTD